MKGDICKQDDAGMFCTKKTACDDKVENDPCGDDKAGIRPGKGT